MNDGLCQKHTAGVVGVVSGEGGGGQQITAGMGVGSLRKK